MCKGMVYTANKKLIIIIHNKMYSLCWSYVYMKICPDTIAGKNKPTTVIYDVPNIPMVVKYQKIDFRIDIDSVEIVFVCANAKKCRDMLYKLQRKDKQYQYDIPNVWDELKN